MEIFLLLNYYNIMNKRYKWKLTKSTLRLVIVSAVAFLGLGLFGLSDLTTLYGMPGYFYLTDIPHFIFEGIKDSFITNYSYYILINLIPIAFIGFAAVICVLCFVFRLKPSNIVTAILIVLGGASFLVITSMGFIFVRDKVVLQELINLALFKNFKSDFMTVIPAIGIWVYLLATVACIPCFFIFIYYAVRDSFNKKPRLKGEAKYFYNHYNKRDLAKLAGAAANGESTPEENTVPATNIQTNDGSATVIRPNVIIRKAPRERKPVVNNITVSRGTPMPERSTNVVQFVHCDDTFVDEVKSKEEKTKGATFLDVQRY